MVNKSDQISFQENYSTQNTVDPSSKSVAKVLTWTDVSYKVGSVRILSNCWGKVEAGSVCAILGPSGAGKSSLLNVLAGRSSTSGETIVEGTITVGATQINPVTYRKNIAYVMQDNTLMSTATPREALRFSANMRLPAETTSAEIEDLVTHLLEELGLVECADVMIGGALIKGISGGQAKRVSVGVEVITSPSLMFLDEPTSGLDSFTAFNLVTLLKAVAKKNCTVLCTIHQPSSEVFFLFDTVIYMKEGRIFYQGPVHDIVPFYSRLGCECPENFNPSDFVMSLAQSDTAASLEKRGLFVPIPADLQHLIGSSKKLDHAEQDFAVQSSFLKQVLALSTRELIGAVRDTQGLATRFGITIVLGLIIGLVFLGIGNRDYGVMDNFTSHVGAVSFLMFSEMSGASQQVMVTFPFERPMFLREYASGTYKTPAYFLAKLLIEIPITFIQSMVQFILIYYLMALHGDFMLEFLACYGVAMAANSVAVFLGCCVPNVKDVTELVPLLIVPQFLFAGIMVPTDSIPTFLRWAQWLCSFKYGINLVLQLEFGSWMDACNTSLDAAANCHNVLVSNDIVLDLHWVYVILLIAIFLFFRIFAAIVLTSKAKKFY